MSILNRSALCSLLLFTAILPANGSSAADSHLLRLVPAGAQIVAGISDPRSGKATGRLLLVTADNNRDLEDCLALLGVDGDKTIDQVSAAVLSSASGDLNGHLLLLAGHFERSRIFNAALLNGAMKAEYQETVVLAIRPFPREQRQTSELRWLAILDDKTALFGVPGMVQRALDRYRNDAVVDTDIRQCLGQLPADVDSWSIVAMPSAILGAKALPPLARKLLESADEIALGIHYGRASRVDFAIHTPDPTVLEGFRDQPQLAPPNFFGIRVRKPKVAISQNAIRGSFVVSTKEFAEWLASMERLRARQP